MNDQDRDFVIELRLKLNRIFNQEYSQEYYRVIFGIITLLQLDTQHSANPISLRQAYQQFVHNPSVITSLHRFFTNMNLFTDDTDVLLRLSQ